MINIITSHDDQVININTNTPNPTQHTYTNTYTLTGDDNITHNMWRYEYMYYTPVSGFWESTDRIEHELQTIRQVRDQALADTDWIVTRSTETNQPLDSNFTQFRSWLRDLPANYTPTQPISCPVESLSGFGIETNIVDKLQPWTYVSVTTAESAPVVDRQRIQYESWLQSVPVTGWSEEYYYESTDEVLSKDISIVIPASGNIVSVPAATNIEVFDIVIADDDEDPEVKQLDLSTIMM